MSRLRHEYERAGIRPQGKLLGVLHRIVYVSGSCSGMFLLGFYRFADTTAPLLPGREERVVGGMGNSPSPPSPVCVVRWQ